jgi:putative transcription factor
MSDNKDGFSHQDWNPVVLKKTQKQLKEMNKGTLPKEIVTNKNYKANSSSTHLSKKLLDEENDDFKIETVSRSLSFQIQQARTAKKISQKDLANQMNTQLSIIQSYENGKATPDGAFLAKMSRVLGVKLKK